MEPFSIRPSPASPKTRLDSIKDDDGSAPQRDSNGIRSFCGERLLAIGGRTMLVLSRKIGERILIGDNIAVTVVRITNGGVRIGIEAPAEYPVIREELKARLDEADARHGQPEVK